MDSNVEEAKLLFDDRVGIHTNINDALRYSSKNGHIEVTLRTLC